MKRLDFLIDCEGEDHRISIMPNGAIHLYHHRQWKDEIFMLKEMAKVEDQDLCSCLRFLRVRRWQSFASPPLFYRRFPKYILDIIQYVFGERRHIINQYPYSNVDDIWKEKYREVCIEKAKVRRNPVLTDYIGYQLLGRQETYKAEIIMSKECSIFVINGKPAISLVW